MTEYIINTLVFLFFFLSVVQQVSPKFHQNRSKSWDIFYIWQKPSVGVYKQIEGQSQFEISKLGA